MEIISTAQIDKYYSIRDVVGKKVMAANGQVVGKVTDIAYDMNRVLGIHVSSLGSKLLIGKEYIGKMHTDSIILKVNPVTTLTGKIVFDKDGKKIGKVSKFNRLNTANDFTDILVRSYPLAKPKKILKQEIEVIGKTIILNKIIK